MYILIAMDIYLVRSKVPDPKVRLISDLCVIEMLHTLYTLTEPPLEYPAMNKYNQSLFLLGPYIVRTHYSLDLCMEL